uniref:Uncharacterized protein n=1 Tax=viral metagenome TaxID=1070528 RepID=A0A6M3JQK6_9ZZZZ
MIYPWEYTYTEGGNFKVWVSGSVTYHQLKKLVGAKYYTIVNGVRVHCLIFETASAGYGNYARWDCVNGWTTTISQARKNFPGGMHGEVNMYNDGKSVLK